MKRVLLAIALLGSTASAQQVTSHTECTQSRYYRAGTITCETTAAPKPVATAFLEGFLNGLRASSARRQAPAIASVAASPVSREVEEAQWRLYAMRAIDVVEVAVDSLVLVGTPADSFRAETRRVLLDLYMVDPKAPTQAIRDAIEPTTRRYSRKIEGFFRRTDSVFAVAADSIGLTGALRDTAYTHTLKGLALYYGMDLDTSSPLLRFKTNASIRSLLRSSLNPYLRRNQ